MQSAVITTRSDCHKLLCGAPKIAIIPSPRNLACILCFFAFLACSAGAQTVPLWGRWEQTFNANASVASETELTAELTSPSGNVFSVAGFWDGGSTWRIRFMPVEVGEWHFRTHSTPAVDGLDQKSGEFLCQPSVGTTRFLQHGPLGISANGRFFEHADRTPFFWMGDTVWYGAILSSKADWDTYLADRASKQFDVVHFNAVAPRNGVAADENGEVSFEGAERFESHSRLGRLLAKALGYLGLNQSKPIRMNPRFYQRLDERIDAVNSHGLLAAIVLTWGLRSQDSGNALPEGEVVRLIRYLESRYGANHVVWIMTGDNAYEGASGERWKRIGRAAFGGERPHAPVTTHPIGMNWPWESFRNEKWLDFIIYQSGHGDDANSLRWIHSGPPSKHWRDSPPRPLSIWSHPMKDTSDINHGSLIATMRHAARSIGVFSMRLRRGSPMGRMAFGAGTRPLDSHRPTTPTPALRRPGVKLCLFPEAPK